MVPKSIERMDLQGLFPMVSKKNKKQTQKSGIDILAENIQTVISTQAKRLTELSREGWFPLEVIIGKEETNQSGGVTWILNAFGIAKEMPAAHRCLIEYMRLKVQEYDEGGWAATESKRS